MKSGTWTENDDLKTRKRNRSALLLSSCLLLAIAGFAQTSIDATHAMAPANLQRTMMLKAGLILPAAKSDARAATHFASMREAPEVRGRSTPKNHKTLGSRSERRKADD